ncbi:MAG: hypothetical protein QOF72_2281, partial [Blastocatellia bacterium]|nr:hypothetical protein [Blastocatellia bacterium]
MHNAARLRSLPGGGVGTGSGSDRVATFHEVRDREYQTRSLLLPVLISLACQ